MSIVLEAALSAFFDVLFDKLSSPDLLKIFRQENVDADIKKWKTILLEISEVLDDAEEKQITKGSVKTWLGELEALAYDADDILDEFATEALRRKLNAEEPSTSKIRKFIPACCVGFNPSSIKFDVSMRSKIEGIHRRLQEIVTQKERLKLQDCTGGRTITTISRPATTSQPESHTYGRDEDKKKIVKLLLESSDAQLFVIPIVGMGGLGKTTLAQLVYKDDEVSRYFKLKAWVCVPEDFDIPRLTKEILHCVTSESCHDELESLERKLQEKLSGEKFLLVLDDVWCENYENWTSLRKLFESGAQGIKIVVTTRNYDVSLKMGTTPAYKLIGLSDDACLRIFTHHALEATDFSEYPELEKYGKKIVDRCKGTPLAAKTLGGLLRNKHDPSDWEDVLNSKIWDIPEDKSSIFSVLKLSYNYLPSHLKRCFAYCSLFPKDDGFEEEDLVLLWMAEGLVQETKGEKPMEDLGGGYFRELLNRSFFQKSSTNESLFVMHDLMNDLAMWAAGDLCCRLEDQLGGSKQSEISTKIRHFSCIKHSNDCIQKFDEDVHLRTFLSLPLHNRYGLQNFDVKYCLFPQLRCLRVLSLSGNDIFELPSSIGDLKHLRYLNLSYTEITSLPESTSSLYNLQTLILKGCFNLKELPKKIENLVNLRHLNIASIREMPNSIGDLKHLRYLNLSHSIIESLPKSTSSLYNLQTLTLEGCSNLKELPEKIENLVNLRHLNITEANSIKEMPAGIAKLNSLRTLCFGDMHEWQDWIPCKVECEDFPCLRELSISNCPNLRYLNLSYSIIESLPKSTSSLYNLQTLTLKGCSNLKELPEKIENLVNLRHLNITEANSIKEMPAGIAKLKSLRTLCFGDMREWQDWIPCKVECEDFPCLRELSISNCPKLEGKFPHHLPSLEKLSINACEQLVVSIPSHLVLQVLKIVGCKEVVLGSVKVEKLIIKNCEKLTSLCEDELMALVTLEIKIKSCCQSPVNIKLKSTFWTLTIEDCCALESLQFVMDEGGASSTTSLLMNEENLSCIGNNNASLLEHLKIFNCPSLKCISTIVGLAAMLKRLDIEKCPNLTSLSSRDTLPTTLKDLRLVDCSKLESIVDKLNKDMLLEDLLIYRCEKLRCLPRGLHELCHLKKIDIHKCNSLVSLGDLLPTNLRSLEIGDCEKLEALPNNIHNLNFLQDLLVLNCPSIVSFPEEGFPTNLKELWLSGANLCKQVFELGLHRLTSLTFLWITNGIMDSFPEEEDGKTMLMLPTSLTTLDIYNFPNLLFLSWKFFQNLSALEEISIGWCPKLAFLSEKCFPPSLQRLHIYHCPVLEQNCEKDKGVMWSMMAKIPSVEIDWVEQQK